MDPLHHDVLTLLKGDHRTIRDLLEHLCEEDHASPQSRLLLRDQVRLQLQVHATVEEQLVYPVFQQLVAEPEEQHLYFEAVTEHQLVDAVLEALQALPPDSAAFHAHAKVLRDLVEHHVREEEKQIFPRMRKVISSEALQHLGRQAVLRKQELFTQREFPARELR